MKKTKLFNIAARNRRAFSELPFELASTLSLQWFCKTPFPDSNYSNWMLWNVPCRARENKNCWKLQERLKKSMYRFMLWIMFNIITRNDSAKYHFLVQCILNWKFWCWMCYLTKAWKKKVLNVAAVNREEQVQQWFSSLCMLISVCA